MKTEDHPASVPKPPYAQLADARLAELSAAGDLNAYSFVYDRHFEEIFDFGIRTVRAAGPAADAVVEAFAEVWQQAGAGKAGLDLRPELFASARGALLADSRIAQAAGRPPEGSNLPEGYSVQAPGDVPARMPAAEYADLVWRASASLNPRDYSLLHINLRGAVSIPDMADALGSKRKQLDSTLRRLKDSLNRSVGSILLMREGHKNCPELDGLIHKLKSADTSPGEIRKEVGEHMEGCRRCGATREAYAYPPDTLAALLSVAAPPGLKRELWPRIVERIESGPAPKPALFASRRAAPGGGVAAVRRGRKPEWLRIAAVITVIALVAAAATAIIRREPPAEVDDPIDVRSASHSLWVPSPTDVVRLGWSPVQGATGFSVEWSKKARDLPDET
ncbi:MAG: RNA polymerase sigma factor, partial [Actinomycetota bacterium]